MFRSLHIGINYPSDTDARLYGCANDAASMATLFRQMGYASTMLIDELPTVPVPNGALVRRGPEHVTRGAILAALREIRDATLSGTVRAVAITYSGHGTQTYDFGREELDGMDEAWVPADYETAGLISDDQLGDILKTFHPETRIFIVSDACHSGTATDLPFQYDATMRASSASRVATTWRGRIVHISGCRDNQTSADAYHVEGARGATGALSACFLATLRERGIHCPLGTLMTTVNQKLQLNRFSQRSLLTTSVRVGSMDTLQLV